MGEEADSAPIRSYRDLDVWQLAVDLAVECYRYAARLPASEGYGMVTQIRRSSASVAANIAEGHGRETTASFVQFLRVAQGSLKELETHLIIADRAGLPGREMIDSLLAKADRVGKMLRSMIRSLQRR